MSEALADPGLALRERVLAAIPQREPFRFVDEILELEPERVLSAVRFRPDAAFYRGHFPGRPVTPGVILVEAMAQGGLVTLAIQRLLAEDDGALGDTLTVFTDANIEFSGLVEPGERVLVEGRLEFFRRRKIRARVEMRRESGELVCDGTLSGMAVTPP
ncbi:MAG: hotdog domain-containing protein [Myxococcota bacterium]|nr:hotdog domain-containing protein [Myxococcota bacterium]